MKSTKKFLSLIRHVGRTFETTPATYSVHDEKELRDIILANLNGIYKGDATGETFRKTGKTDIRIEHEDRSAFVSECKVWRGPKGISLAIDQLLGYLTRRDCKATIIIFNKHNVHFSELLKKVPETMQIHPQHNKYLGEQGSGEWRFILNSSEDETRRIITHVFLFNPFYY